jgi:hypothetical protein
MVLVEWRTHDIREHWMLNGLPHTFATPLQLVQAATTYVSCTSSYICDPPGYNLILSVGYRQSSLSTMQLTTHITLT